ncbi:DNA repair protein RecN [Streptomyces hirsutus]
MTEELASLAMPHARVSFAIRQTEAADEASGIDIGGRSVVYGPSGADEVELLLAHICRWTSPGRSPRVPRAVSCPG